nr:MAG: nonstructural protein [Microviridae sp.]
MLVYTVYNTLEENSGPFFQVKNDKVASRQFLAMLADPKIAPMAAEFQLFCVGTYNSESMQLVACQPRRIIVGESVLKGDEDGER